MPLRVNPKAVLVYLFAVAILYLAGVYLGGVLLLVFFLCALLPVFSLVQVLIFSYFLKYQQEFSTEYPVKGESVYYRLHLTNESFFPVIPVYIRFKQVTPGGFTELEDLRALVSFTKQVLKEYTIKCPFRGNYIVGLERLEVGDFLGFITYSLKVQYRTFVVYPRIITVYPSFARVLNNRISVGAYSGRVEDNTLIKTLNKYRDGMSIKHMAWKKFMAFGEPYLKEYDETAQPGMDVYLDLRREKEADYLLLEREDCSVEILVAVVHYFLKSGITINVHAFSSSRFAFKGNNLQLFELFYRSTTALEFAPTISPVRLLESDIFEGKLATSSVLFITHNYDAEVLDWLNARSANALNASIIINQVGMDRGKIKLFKNLNSHGAYRNIIFVRGSDTIKHDLEI